jgi:DUF1365 family protein
MTYLDLSELDTVFEGSYMWSSQRPALAWMRREDHMGDVSVSLDQAVTELVCERTGKNLDGPIRLLTHLRYFGYNFNPVSFYFCFDSSGDRVETIVAEVNNTPWGERHCYVLDEAANLGEADKMKFRFHKEFHVSPFMSMDHQYHWQFNTPGTTLAIHMENHLPDGRLFDATMVLRRKPITRGNLSSVLVRYPFMTGKVITAIYWNALLLWLKRVPFHTHPDELPRDQESKAS